MRRVELSGQVFGKLTVNRVIGTDGKGHVTWLCSCEAGLQSGRDCGLDVVLPENDELQIDIDNEHSYMLYNNLLAIVKKFIGIENVTETKSKSGKEWNMHITVQLSEDVTPIERLALQAMLGSDRVRELLGYIQLKNGDPAPTLFLEKKAPAQLTEGQ